MKLGEAVGPSVPAAGEDRFARLAEARERAQNQLSHLPDDLLTLDSDSKYPVEFSERLNQEREKLEHRIIAMQEPA